MAFAILLHRVPTSRWTAGSVRARDAFDDPVRVIARLAAEAHAPLI